MVQDTVRVFCVLKSGGIYTADHVRCLSRQIRNEQLWCLSDVVIPDVPTIPLKHGWPGWWSKLELFSLNEDLLYIDLDSVVLGDIQQLVRAETTACRDFLQPKHINSSVMFIKSEDSGVYEQFCRSPEKYIREYRSWPAKWGDQGFIESCLPNVERFEKGLVRSYRKDCISSVPEGTVVVSFHGKPKPWAIPGGWVSEFYNGS